MTTTSRRSYERTQDVVQHLLENGAAELVEAYYCPTPRDYPKQKDVLFAGRHFDEMEGNDPEKFTPGDLAAASLLDVRFGAHAVVALLEESECNNLLAGIPTHVTLAEAGEAEVGHGSMAWQLWDRLVAIRGVNSTRASKLLARKRPLLMPILDSVIVKNLELGKTNHWRTVQEVVAHLGEQIDLLTAPAMAHGARRPSTLRLLDVATWMRFSGSRQARAVRATVLPPER